jgi:hypothetical protein
LSDVRSECSKCTRLWHEYKVATIEHKRLDGNARVAALEYNREKVEALAPRWRKQNSAETIFVKRSDATRSRRTQERLGND